MPSYEIKCDYCHARAYRARPGRFCSDRHRAYFHRDALIAQRARLAEAAELAIRSGDVFNLEQVARRAVTLLSPAN